MNSQIHEIEAPCSKLQGIFDPQGRIFILIARYPRSKLRGMLSRLDSSAAKRRKKHKELQSPLRLLRASTERAEVFLRHVNHSSVNSIAKMVAPP